MLKTVLAAATLAACAAATLPAIAATDHLSDSQYLTAVRCRALIASPALGKGDTGALDAMLKSERVGRVASMADRADEIRSDAARQASHAGSTEKAQLDAERDGLCQAYVPGATTAAAAQSGLPAGAN